MKICSGCGFNYTPIYRDTKRATTIELHVQCMLYTLLIHVSVILSIIPFLFYEIIFFDLFQCFDGASDLPTVSFNFRPISSLEQIPKDTLVGERCTKDKNNNILHVECS